MFCKECGKKVEDGNKFCTGCGRRIEPISTYTISNNEELYINRKENSNIQNINYNNQNYSNQNVNYVAKEDKPSILLNIVSFFIPIVGLILFLTMRNETPKKAKSIGITALIGYIFSIIVSVLLVIFFQAIFFINQVDDDYYYNYDKYDMPYYYYNERDYNI